MISSLFFLGCVQTDITDKVEEFSKDIEKRIENMIKIIESEEEPRCSIGVYCADPYECAIKEECWKDVPEGSTVMNQHEIIKIEI